MTERIVMPTELIVGLLGHMLESGPPKENVSKLNELMCRNVRILRDEEIAYGK